MLLLTFTETAGRLSNSQKGCRNKMHASCDLLCSGPLNLLGKDLVVYTVVPFPNDMLILCALMKGYLHV